MPPAFIAETDMTRWMVGLLASLVAVTASAGEFEIRSGCGNAAGDAWLAVSMRQKGASPDEVERFTRDNIADPKYASKAEYRLKMLPRTLDLVFGTRKPMHEEARETIKAECLRQHGF